MKIARFTVVALLATLLTMGCSEEKLSFNYGSESAILKKGILSLSNLNIECRVAETSPEIGLEPSNSTLSTKSSRSSVDIDNFDCWIIDDKSDVVRSFKYSERPTEDIELPTGEYILKIQSGELPNAEWEKPVYGVVYPFKIVRNDLTEISVVVCSLMQIMVSVSYSDDLLERLGPKTLTTVSVKNNPEVLSYGLTEKRAGYFLAPQTKNTIELCTEGTYAADKINFKNVKMTNRIDDVTAGHHRNVHLFIEHAADGNIKIDAVIRDWVTDEVIPCNVSTLVKEEEWVEGGNEGGSDTPATPAEDPRVVWVGHDISKRETITANTDCNIEIYANHGVKELIVQIESEPLSILLPQVGLVDVINLTYPEKSYDSANPKQLTDEQVETLKQMLRPASEGGLLGFKFGEDVINQTKIEFSISEFMGPLSSMAGNHDFHFNITDNEGKTINPSLMLKSTGM